MSIMSGSAGGVFDRTRDHGSPDLFGAAVDQVPFSDTLRGEVSASGPANIPERSNEGFRGLYAMSPLITRSGWREISRGTPDDWRQRSAM